MKNLLYALGIAGSMLTAGNSYSQTDSVNRGNINVEKVSIDVNTSSEYGKSITSDFLMNTPHKLHTEELTRNELELFYLDIATEYKKTLEKYGNLKRDCEADKIKAISLESQVKTLISDKVKLQTEIKDCKDKSLPEERREKGR